MATILKKRIEQYCRLYHSEVIAIRRHIHANPELAFEEYKTADFITQKLTQYEIPFKANVAKTGIVGFIEGKNPNKVIALRADMDALPMQEENDLPYKSKTNGIMHACGHDAHIAMLLVAARILNDIKDDLEGSIKLIFQPSEEAFPGGAKIMIEEGVLENPKVRHVIGQHVLPTMESGKVGFKEGKYMASTDEVYLKIIGKGGHGATPEMNIDPILVASHIIVALQQLVSRMSSPNIPTVLSFGKFIAQGRTNVIPNEVNIDGTLRTFNEIWRAEAHKKITTLCTKMAESMGAICEVTIDHGYPFVENDSELTKDLNLFAKEFLGEKNVEELEPRMTAEDFSYYGQKVPSSFYRIGTMKKNKKITNLHTTSFDIDEEALLTGIGTMAYMAFRTLEELID